MKKSLLFSITLSLIFMCSVSNAQPIITASGTNPVIGETISQYTSSTSYSPGSSGAGATWNLSTIAGTLGSFNVVSPGSTPNGSSFPTSNVAWSFPTAVSYYKTSATALQSCGFYGNGVAIAYSNPEDYLRFPFTYNNTYVDSWAAQFVSGGYTFYRTGNTTVTADGYGTLTTPTATYTNVLRVHYVQAYKDSSFIGVPYVINYNNDEYMWYKDGFRVQLATIYTLTSTNGGPYYGASYIGAGVGIDQISNLMTSSSLFPNPATDQVTIDFTLTENKKVEVFLFDAIGQKVDISQSAEAIQGKNSMQLDVSDLSEGIYFAQIVFDGNIAATKRFVISK